MAANHQQQTFETAVQSDASIVKPTLPRNVLDEFQEFVNTGQRRKSDLDLTASSQPAPPSRAPAPSSMPPRPAAAQPDTADKQKQQLVGAIQAFLRKKKQAVTLGELSLQVKSFTGHGWGGHWEHQYGSLALFLKDHPEAFSVVKNKYVVCAGQEDLAHKLLLAEQQQQQAPPATTPPPQPQPQYTDYGNSSYSSDPFGYQQQQQYYPDPYQQQQQPSNNWWEAPPQQYYAPPPQYQQQQQPAYPSWEQQQQYEQQQQRLQYEQQEQERRRQEEEQAARRRQQQHEQEEMQREKDQWERDEEMARRLQEEEFARHRAASTPKAAPPPSPSSSSSATVVLSTTQMRDLAERELGIDNVRIIAGFSVKKFGREGRPHQRKIWVTQSLTHVAWQSSLMEGNHRGIELKYVTQVAPGMLTPTIAKNTSDAARVRALCFSIVTQARTLDMEACSVIQRDTLVNALRAVVDFNRKYKPEKMDRDRTRVLLVDNARFVV